LSLSVCRRNDFCALVFVPDVQSFWHFETMILGTE
jgi:hypothetical protein